MCSRRRVCFPRRRTRRAERQRRPRLAVFRDLVNSLDLPDLPDEPHGEPEGGASN